MDDVRSKMEDVRSKMEELLSHTFKALKHELGHDRPRTFSRYLDSRREILKIFGVSPKAQKLPPYAVRYICEDYCIDLPPELQDQQAFNASPIRDIILQSWEEEQKYKNNSRLSDKVGQRPSQM